MNGKRRRRGFLLLEMVLALTVFGIAATGFAVALNRMARLAALSQAETRVMRVLESSFLELFSRPLLEQGEEETEVGPPEDGMVLLTEIKPIEDLENERGELLQEMFLLRATIRWKAEGGVQERSMESWRYGRMYQP
jgi:prepilin-type N-terminal cleavage/methylation domain-containing protein